MIHVQADVTWGWVAHPHMSAKSDAGLAVRETNKFKKHGVKQTGTVNTIDATGRFHYNTAVSAND